VRTEALGSPHGLKVVHVAEFIKGGIATYLEALLPLQAGAFGAANLFAVLPASHCAGLQLGIDANLIRFDNSGSRLANTFRLAIATCKLVIRIKPDVIHIHSTFAGAVLRPLLALLRCRAKIIYCPHGWAFDRESPGLIKGLTRTIERILARFCHAIVCISQHEVAAARASRIEEQKLVLVRNGISRAAPRTTAIAAPPQWRAGKLRLLFVGRLDRQKGIDVLFRALQELREDAFALIIGAPTLRDFATPAAVDNSTSLGWMSGPQIETYYRSADVLLVPSRWEGFGLVAVEAMRAGLPVVASNVGGLAEIVADGLTGVLVAPGDHGALAGAIRALSAQQRQRMGVAGRQRFLELFTIERAHEELCALYRKLAAQGAPQLSHARVSRVESVN